MYDGVKPANTLTMNYNEGNGIVKEVVYIKVGNECDDEKCTVLGITYVLLLNTCGAKKVLVT